MKNKTKKIVIITLNAISIFLNLLFLLTIALIKLLEQNVPEYKQIAEANNIGAGQIIIFVACIILSILTILFSIKFEKNKTKIGLCIVTSTMLGSLVSVIAGFISIIILYKKNKQEREEALPKLPIIKNKILSRIIYGVLFIWLFISLYIGVFNLLLGNVLALMPMVLRVFVVYLYQLLMTGVPLLENIVRDTREFFKNRKVYFREMVKTVAYMILFYVPVSVVLKLITGGTSTNQSLLEGLPVWFMLIIGVIIGPICEELMFRGYLRKIVKNKFLFIAISGVIFGAIHCMYEETNYLMYLYIIPYSILGFGFAKLYSKTDNILTNIFVHMGWNFLAFMLMLVVGN